MVAIMSQLHNRGLIAAKAPGMRDAALVYAQRQGVVEPPRCASRSGPTMPRLFIFAYRTTVINLAGPREKAGARARRNPATIVRSCGRAKLLIATFHEL